MKKVLLAAPRGFCAGVSYAIELVNRALETFGTPLYVRHAIVHNEHVVEGLEQRGVVFVEDLDEVPEGAPVVFSAHGVSPTIRESAARRNLKIIDATCPLVEKVHREAREWAGRGYTILYIGHAGHVEAVGTMGECPGRMILVDSAEHAQTVDVPNPEKLVVLTQTTLSVDEVTGIIEVLKRRFPHLRTPRKEDICYATTNRQEAVKLMAEQCDLILVVGSNTSSNSNRLREVAEACGAISILLNSVDDVDPTWADRYDVIGLTSGASTPEVVVDEVLRKLMNGTPVPVETLLTAEERIVFRQPRELIALASLAGQ